MGDDGAITRASAGVQRVLGVSPESLAGATASTVIERGAVGRLVERVRSSGQAVRDEVQHEGTTLAVTATRDSNGFVVTLCPCPTLDAERFRVAFREGPAGATIADGEGRLVDANRAFQETFGYHPGDIEGTLLRDLAHPEDRTRIAEMRQRMLDDGSHPVRDEYRLLRNDGSAANVVVSSVLVRDGAGVPRYFVRHYEDVTSLRRAEAALAESEEQFRVAFEDAPSAMAILGPAGSIEQCNSAFARMVQAPPEALAGRTLADLGAPHQALTEAIAGSRERGNAPVAYDLCREDGSCVPVEGAVSLLPLRGSVKLLVQLVDVSDRKRAEEQVRVMHRMEGVERIAGGVAHEFNNMLSIVVNYADMLARDVREDPKATARVAAIRTAADRCAAVTRRLMVLGRRDVEPATLLDVNEAATRVAELVGSMLGDRVVLRLRLTEPLGRVRMTRTHVEEILTDLVVNASEAIEGSGTIDIETEESVGRAGLPPGSYVVLRVRDTGAGMSPEVRRQVFDPFFTTKKQRGRSGLGLPVAHRIVTAAGGSIDIDSGPGRGTCVTLWLPVAARAPAVAPRPERPVRGGSGEVVLVAEDEPALRELTARILERRGYVVHAFPDGAAALHWLASYDGRLDLLLSDVVMPRISGLELATRARVLRPELRVAFVSGHTDFRLDEDSVRRGEVAFLPKPFDAAQLAAFVRAVLDDEWPGRRSR